MDYPDSTYETWVYRDDGRVRTHTDGRGRITTYRYDADDRLSGPYASGYKAVDYPNNTDLYLTRDYDGLVTELRDASGTNTATYYLGGWLKSLTNGAGKTVTYQYNGVGLISTLTTPGSLWDHTGNPLKRVENFGGSNFTTTLRYDNVYRMTEETKRDSGGVVQYTLGYGYDAVGNRISRALGGVTTTYVYDDNDKLTSTSGGGQSATLGYDGNGNMTSVSGTMFGAKTLVYDDENQLTSLLSGGVTDLYYYSALGQRYRARLGGTYWRYVYNGDRVLEETNDSGTVQSRYTTADPSLFSPLLHMWRTSSTSRFPLYDLTGSARELVDANGAVTDTYTLDAFGRTISSTGSTTNPYKYDAAWGYITDPSGFQQLGARFYWPEVGRFVQQDPIGSGMNWYAYVGGNPVVFVDPPGTGEVSDAFLGMFDWHNWADGMRAGINSGYYAGWGKDMAKRQFPYTPENYAKGKAAKAAATGYARGYFGLKYPDKFKAWGKYSKKMVPELAGKAAAAYAVGDAFKDMIQAIGDCAPLLNGQFNGDFDNAPFPWPW